MLHSDGKSGGEKPLQLPSVRCYWIKSKADNAEITCTNISTLFQLMCLVNASQFTPRDQRLEIVHTVILPQLSLVRGEAGGKPSPLPRQGDQHCTVAAEGIKLHQASPEHRAGLMEDIKSDGNFLYQSIHNLSRRLWAVEDRNETKNCKVSASQVAQVKEFDNITINYDETERWN